MPDLPRVGEEFGNYRLGQRLGRGGMSVVYQAENWRLGNVVALKILAPDLANDDIFRTRFLQESRIAAGFNHPHVVPIIDSGAYDGLLYIAMRYVAGTDLRQIFAVEGDVAADRPGAGEWSFYSAGGNGDADGRPSRRRPARRYRQSRTRLTALGLVVLAVLGTGAWMLAAQPFKAKAPAAFRPAAATQPSGLFSVLEQTEKFVPSGDLNLSGCTQVSKTDVECAHPSAAVADVSFVTYPTLGAVYLHYKEIIAGLTKESFAAIQNKGACDATAPDPTGESTWNHSNGGPAAYTASQMATGTVPTDMAMGRVLCEQLSNGSEKIVWTADSGKFLGYATGTASHEQVYLWWYYVHHQIIFPGDTGMSRTMPMPSPAGTGSPPASMTGTTATASASSS